MSTQPVDSGLAYDGESLVMVHPGDVDLPRIKARAAELGHNVVVSRVVPVGQAIFMPQGVLRFPGER